MKSKRASKRVARSRRAYWWAATAVALGVLVVAGVIAFGRGTASRAVAARESVKIGGDIELVDARRQAADFIAYDEAIVLKPDQKKVMDDALSAIPAPCCSEFSLATCCCPCNLARSAWGLSKLLISKHHANVAEVREAATKWVQFINAEGYSGDVCASKGCNRAFEENGCGGMDSRHIQ